MRIAHLSDLRFRRQVPGPAVPPQVRSHEMSDILPTALVDARSRGADLVVVTGDLVEVPRYLGSPDRDAARDAAVWQAISDDYRTVVELLEDSGLPWVVAPGVHDALRPVSAVLRDAPAIRDVGSARVISFWDRLHEHGPQRVGSERIRFAAALADPDPTLQIHLQHAALTSPAEPLRYLEADDLRRRLATRTAPTLVLSSHEGRGAEPERHGGALFSLTPALARAPHSYRLFDLADGSTGTAWEQVDLVPAPERSKVVYLDRDGCINTLPTYHSGPEAMELLPGAPGAIRRLRAAGYRVVVVTNQACVGAGLATPAIVAEVHDRMAQLLAREGAAVDAIYASFEAAHPIDARFSTTKTRKPSPAMLLQAADDLHLDLASGYMVGDRSSDIEAGRAAGVVPILVRTGDGRSVEHAWQERGESPCRVVDDLAEASELILTGWRA